jgi:hypothetical protein
MILSAGLGAALLALPYVAGAHHAFNAEYDAEKPLTLIGVLTKVDQQNPHGWIYMDVKPATPTGRTINWQLETPGPNQLVNTGFIKTLYEEIIAKKEVVTVKAYAAKDGSKHAFAETLVRADGRTTITISTSGVKGNVGANSQTGQNVTVDGVVVDQGPVRGGGGTGVGGRGTGRGTGRGAPGGGTGRGAPGGGTGRGGGAPTGAPRGGAAPGGGATPGAATPPAGGN